MNLADSVDEASISESEILGNGNIPILLDSVAHDFFKTRVNNVDFISTVNFRSFITETHKLK